MPDYRNALSQMLPNCKCNRNKQRVLYPLVETETGVSLISYTSTLHLQNSGQAGAEKTTDKSGEYREYIKQQL